MPEPRPYSTIWGTTVSLQIPDGFWIADGFLGLAGTAGASILVTEIPEPMAVVRTQMSESALRDRGMQLLDVQTVRRDGADHPLVCVAQPEPGGEMLRRWIFVLGDDRTSAVLVASAAEVRADELADPFEHTLRTARRDPDREIGIFEGLGFTLAETASLAIAGRRRNIVALEAPGIADGGPGEARFLVGRAELPSAVDPRAFSSKRLEQTPRVTLVAVVSERVLDIDGMPAFELIAEAVDRESPTPLILFQTIVFDGDRYFLLQGRVAASGADRFVPEFRQIASGLQRSRQ